MSGSKVVRAAILSGALLIGSSAGTAGAQAPSSGPSPAFAPHGHQGRVLFPTREAKKAAGATGAASGTGVLAYGGGVSGIGVTTGPPTVYLVFWGSQWGTASTDANGITTFSGDRAGMAPRIQQMFKGLGTNQETWSGVMTQYCEGVATGATTCPSTVPHVGYPSGSVLAGVLADPTAAPPNASGNQLANEAIKAAIQFKNTSAASNRNVQYVIVSPSGTHPDGFNTANGNFCAWHDWNGDTTLTGGAATSNYGPIAFTNLPYIPDMGSSCGQSYVNAGNAGALDGVTIVGGHEYAETITDQNPAGGWTDQAGYENADKCAWNGVGGPGGANAITFATGTFAMQSTYSNDATGCQISHPIVTTGGGTGNTITVTNPGNQTSTVGTAVNPLQIQATDSANAALTFSATGLPAGLAISPAGLISGKPSSAGNYPVTVTATDGTGAKGSTGFTWTVSGSGTSTCPSTPQLLGNSGFETGSAAPWTASAGVIDSSTAEPAHAGTWKAWLDGYGTSHTDRLSQTVTIPAGCTSATFSFWLHVDTAETTSSAVDRLTVQAAGRTLATYSNLNRSSGYSQKTFTLTGLSNSPATVTFTGTENASRQTSFVVDDASLTPQS